MYVLLFLIGLIGFAAMVGLGFVHTGHGHGHAVGDGHHGHVSHTLNHNGPALPHGPAQPHGLGAHHVPADSSHHGLAGDHHSASTGIFPRLGHGLKSLFILSPMDIFSMSLGAGAAGLLLGNTLSGPALIYAAMAAALFMNFGITKPMMAAFGRFAGRPSEGLEGAVAQPAEALTNFDDSGKGLIRLSLEGEVVQLLALLDPDEVHHGVRVSRGDQVLITSVDAARNTCRVTRDLAS